MSSSDDFQIKALGPCRIASPLKNVLAADAQQKMFVRHDDHVWITPDLRSSPENAKAGLALEKAGPREEIHFDPAKTRCGIVSCGGLCPGINDVIRGLVRHLWQVYGVRRIHGFRYGYQGLVAKYGHSVIDCDLEQVDGIEAQAGTLLGSSRGNQAPSEMVDCLERMGINILFVIGGDGTLRGAQAMAAEIAQRGLKIAVVGVPKPSTTTSCTWTKVSGSRPLIQSQSKF
jgi:6-phosphofructokinase 1